MRTQPVRKTTALLLTQAALAYNREVAAIADAAIADGEAPAGTTLALDLNASTAAVWQLPDLPIALVADDPPAPGPE